MSLRIEVNGIEYERFPAANAILRLDALARTFSFEATAEDAVPLPFRGGEACKINVDGETVITGFIEIVTVKGDDGSHSIEMTGRGRTGDLLDSSIGSLGTIRPGTLKSVVKQVIAHLDPLTPQADRLQVVDEVGPDPFNKAEDLAAAEPGQNAFEFLEKLARKRQVLLTSNGEGNLVIARGSGVKIPKAFILHRVADNSNNVLGYDATFNLTGRFNTYEMVTQLNMGAINLGGTPVAASVASQGHDKAVRDRAIRRGRQLILVGESMSSGPEDERRATWEQNIRRARGTVYSATVDGFRNQAGLLWEPNTLISVIDEYADIEATMLVNEVEFNLDDDTGSTTTLSFVEGDAYSLALEEPETEELGGGFVLS